MTFEQFKYYLDAYGASLHRWPTDTRAAAQALLASDHAATTALAEARRLDGLLDCYALAEDQTAREHLIERIAMRAAAAPVPRGRLGFSLDLALGAIWPRAAALAFVTVLGIMTGIFQVDLGSDDQQPASSGIVQLQADDTPFDVTGL